MDQDREGVCAVTRAHEAFVAQVRPAWTLHQGAHVLTVLRTGDPDHLAQNIAADALRLSEQDVALLASLLRSGAS